MPFPFRTVIGLERKKEKGGAVNPSNKFRSARVNTLSGYTAGEKWDHPASDHLRGIITPKRSFSLSPTYADNSFAIIRILLKEIHYSYGDKMQQRMCTN